MPKELLDLIIEKIIQLYDDEQMYAYYVNQAIRVGLEKFKIEDAAERADEIFKKIAHKNNANSVINDSKAE